MEIEILEFQVPAENSKMLLVWDIEPSHTKAQVYEKLYSIFSCFGPLYLLKVCSNAPQNPPGFYALIRFYSALQASKAQYHTDGQALFQTSPLKVAVGFFLLFSTCSRASTQCHGYSCTFVAELKPVKVRLGSTQTQHCPLSVRRRGLSHSHCVDLANHFLGFNGWRTDIITLEELTDEDEAAEGNEPFRRLKFGCQLELCFPHHRQSIRAAAVVEDSFTCTGEFGSAPPGLVALPRRCKLQRLVRERALVQAFSKVLLILTGEEKVMLEVKHTPDQLPRMLTEEMVQVSEFTPDRNEDDEEYDLAIS